jgi:hypothetical protein
MIKWLPLILDFAMRFFGFWMKDKAKKEEYDREVNKRLEELQKETATSADIRHNEAETNKRLLERLRSRTHGVAANDSTEKKES